jgi:hypothetical protein
VGDENDGRAPTTELRHSPEALLLKALVAHRQDLVDQEDIWLQMHRDGEPQARVHPGGVVLDRHVDEFPELRKLDDLTVEGVTGTVEAKTVNGQITSSRLGGSITLSTVNGRIEAALGTTDSSGTVKLNTVNGAIVLALPANAAARISASTLNGQITNEFNLPAPSGRFVGRSLEGQIGSGGGDIRINTVNGRISIAKTSDV